MNNVFVYIETEGGKVADVSLELLTKGRELADRLGCKLEALAIGHEMKDMDKIVGRYGADTLWLADDAELAPYRTLPHTAVVCGIFGQEQPQIALFGATPVGRDLAPRVSSTLQSGLTADCTSLVIGDHTDAKSGQSYENLLYQIRPAFGGNIIATIVNPDHRPQMATVREGVMRKEELAQPRQPEVKRVDVAKFVKDSDLVVKIIDRQIEERGIDIKGAPVIVAGGYGMGSKENFALLHELADLLGGEVGRRGCGVCRSCPPDRADGCDGASEALHRLRHLRADTAYGGNGSVLHRDRHQYRSGGTDQQVRRLCDHRQRHGDRTQNDQVL
jgi:electron transfer flavoprotein alpha subunit